MTIANSETSFAQSSKDTTCCCCGEKGHVSSDCPKKDATPKSKWAIQKVEEHMQEADHGQTENDDKVSQMTEAESAASARPGRT